MSTAYEQAFSFIEDNEKFSQFVFNCEKTFTFTFSFYHLMELMSRTQNEDDMIMHKGHLIDIIFQEVEQFDKLADIISHVLHD